MHWLIKGSKVCIFLFLATSSCTIFRPELISNLPPIEEIGVVALERESNFSFEIHTDSTAFRNGAPIIIGMSITNNSDSAVLVNKRFLVNAPDIAKDTGSGEVYLIITSSTGDTLPFDAIAEVSYPVQADYAILFPGKKLASNHQENLSRYYNFHHKGEYCITGYYYNFYSEGIEPKPWQGKIESNTITILIE
ncbi:hypothetical protein KJ068_30435 [bacterium]|nr:hypothetical protein [bacterium]